jgi:hypothetical protein
MIPTKYEFVKLRLQRIANVLLLNASFIDNLGFLDGKMGVAVFFYHYAKLTKNKVYLDYAGKLIDEIYEEISQATPVNFASGLTGIAWGIEYLVSKGFVEADIDEALSEIDNAVFAATIQRPVYIESQNDLFGFGLYYLSRFKGRENDDNNTTVLFMKQMTVFMVDECERLLVQKKYLEEKIPGLSAGLLNSILYFLLEVHHLGLFPVKVSKLLQCLPPFMEAATSGKDNNADLQTMLHLAKLTQNMIHDTSVNTQYQRIADLLTNLPEDENNNETLIHNYCRLNWQNMVYPKVNHNTSVRFEKVFSIIDQEENWSKRLDRLNNYNLGLDKGLAGLGMVLITEIQREEA